MELSEVVDYIRNKIFEHIGVRTFWEGFNGKRPNETAGTDETNKAYMTVEILEPYIPMSENKECEYVTTDEGLERQTKDTFESIIQFKIYASEEVECAIAFSKFQRYSAYKLRMDLQKQNVAYVNISTLRGLMNFETDDKEVIKTFDLRIRLTDVIQDEIDYFNKVELKGSESHVI